MCDTFCFIVDFIEVAMYIFVDDEFQFRGWRKGIIRALWLTVAAAGVALIILWLYPAVVNR